MNVCAFLIDPMHVFQLTCAVTFGVLCAVFAFVVLFGVIKAILDIK